MRITGTHGEREESERQAAPAATVTMLEPGAIFGEQEFLEGSRYSHTVTASDKQLICVGFDEDMLRVLQASMSKVIRRSEAAGQPLEKASIARLDDVKITCLLGTGGYGTVKMARHKGTGMLYAVKELHKGKVIAKRQSERVCVERKMLAQCDHPFIIELAAAFQDASTLYLLMELILGGEFHGLLSRRRRLTEKDATFYAATVAVTLEYLHDRRIAYRDLKPENLLIDQQGYLKLVDFGFAKIVDDKTWTLCGTPEYIAPEMILRKGHDCRVDWWSVGVLLYEVCVLSKS